MIPNGIQNNPYMNDVSSLLDERRPRLNTFSYQAPPPPYSINIQKQQYSTGITQEDANSLQIQRLHR